MFEQDQFEAGFFTEERDSTQGAMKIGENIIVWASSVVLSDNNSTS